MRALRGMLLLAVVGVAPAQAEVDFGELARRQLQVHDCQSDLPDADPAAAAGSSGPGARTRPGGRTDGEPGSPEPGLRLSFPAVGADVAAVLFWVFLGLVAAVLLAAILARGRARAKVAGPARPVRAGPVRSPEPASAALPEPEALAAAGRFDAAIHGLLLLAFRALARHRGAPLPAHATGRELLALVEGEGIADLTALVMAVERSRFGGRGVGESDFRVSVAHYQRWSEVCGQARW